MSPKSKSKVQANRGKSEVRTNRTKTLRAFEATPKLAGNILEQKSTGEIFRLLSEQSLMGITIIQDSKVIFANQAMANINGRSVSEMLAWQEIPFKELIHPDDFDFAVGQARKKQHGDLNVVNHYAYRLMRPDGSERWVDQFSETIQYNKRPADMITMLDITEQRKAEDGLRASNERYRLLFSNSMDAVLLTTPDGNILEANAAACEMLGRSEEEIIHGGRISVADITDPRLNAALEERTRTGKFKGELTFLRKNGSKFTGEISTQIFTDQSGQTRTSMVIRDITERIRNDEALRESEQRYKTLFDAAPIQIFTKDREGRYTSSNAENQTYWKFDKIGYTDSDLSGVKETEEVRMSDQHVIETGERLVFEQTIPTSLGERTLLTSKAPLHDAAGNIIGLLGASVDITERKQIEHALRENQQRLSLFFNQSLDGFFFSMLDEPIEWNDASDKTKLLDYVISHQHITEANDAMILQYGSTREKIIGRTARDFFAHDLDQALRFRRNLFDAGRLHLETEEHKDDGAPIWIEGDYVCIYNDRNQITGMFGIQRDVTSRKRAEEILQEAENKYRNLVERLPQVIYTSELGHNGNWLYVSPQVESLLGFTPQEWLADPSLWYRQAHPEDRDQQLALENEAHARNEPFESEYRMLTRAGNWIWVRDSGHILPSQSGGSPVVQGIMMDISERKQAEEALSVSKAQLLANLNNTPNVAVQWYDRNGHILFWNPASESMYGWKSIDAIGKTLDQLIHTPEEQAEFMRILTEVQATGKPFGPYEARVRRRDSTSGWVLATTFSIPIQDEQIGFVCMDVDITERKQAEERIQQQLQRLNALHSIDMAINSSANMQITLEVLLNQTLSQLNVDAADVLIFNQPAQTLELIAERGFRSNHAFQLHQRLSESFASQVINERRTIHISNLMEAGKNLGQIRMLASDHFTEYFGLPLIAKGQLKGVLEIYHRLPLSPENDWLNFLEALAGQAAIAIDNSQLLQGLQRSNMEIVLAYDATIEGWSRAMDLRDKETEGHTQRVTAMTVRLARTIGIREADIIHIQRGGLLHDIGKLGVPDGILLKPDSLTEEEWQIMRQHPAFAFNMLAPISYLKKAIDIPYCHHEKWDGTGYPHGLKGEQIPLAARIFAIADVWDALTSDRPYRKAWSKEQTIEYIQEKSGSHFDPQIVDVFLKMISKEL